MYLIPSNPKPYRNPKVLKYILGTQRVISVIREGLSLPKPDEPSVNPAQCAAFRWWMKAGVSSILRPFDSVFSTGCLQRFEPYSHYRLNLGPNREFRGVRTVQKTSVLVFSCRNGRWLQPRGHGYALGLHPLRASAVEVGVSPYRRGVIQKR